MSGFTRRWSNWFVLTQAWNYVSVNYSHGLPFIKRKLYRYNSNVSHDETVGTYNRKQGKRHSGTGEYAVWILKRNVKNRTKICT